MRTLIVIIPAVLLLPGCRRETTAVKATEEEPHTESLTRWTEKTELFLEYPPLIAGGRSRFAVHLTRLDTFKPVNAGQVEVRLQPSRGPALSFVAQRPSRPGIFGVEVEPKPPGEFRLLLRLSAQDLTDEHDLGMVQVFANSKAAVHHDRPAPEETIAFLKEQQWTLDFATEVARPRPARESLRVPGEVIPRTGGEAEVIVPFPGRLASHSLPAPGTMVEKGQVLATLLPPASSTSELPTLELARAEADTALQLARKDRQRAERLLSAGAAPAKRLDEARMVEQVAEARLTAALARLGQYQAIRDGSADSPSPAFLLRAPISGLVTEAHATAGANVDAGQVLFMLVDAKALYCAAIVPEAELPRIGRFREAELEIPGRDGVRLLNRLVSVGRLVDPVSRTFRVIFEVSNRDRSLAVNQAVFVRLLGPAAAPGISIPATAVVDDGGRPVVFVQLEGEAFARRPVRLGQGDSRYVQVLEGVKSGERVVSRGAYLIRLAALSSQIPAHGHVH